MCSTIRKQFALVAWSENNGKGEGFVLFHKCVFLSPTPKNVLAFICHYVEVMERTGQAVAGLNGLLKEEYGTF